MSVWRSSRLRLVVLIIASQQAFFAGRESKYRLLPITANCSAHNHAFDTEKNEGSAMPTVLGVNHGADESGSPFASGGRFDLRCLGGQSRRLLELESRPCAFLTRSQDSMLTAATRHSTHRQAFSNLQQNFGFEKKVPGAAVR